MGRCAAELILERIHNPSSEAKEIVLPVELVIRSSSTIKPLATAS
jgi:DNA-binding LacI/PurR family transcriptional regulator